jgi:hypothetical protein
LQNDPVDEGGWFSQMLASRKTTAEYTKMTKTSVAKNLCQSVFIRGQTLCVTSEISVKKISVNL